MDLIYATTQVNEKSAESNKPLYMDYIDYEKYFDTFEIAAVMEALRDEGVEENYKRLLENV